MNVVRGQGVGTVLLQHAIEQLAATKVDVNEQNPQAVDSISTRGSKLNRAHHLMIWENLFQFCI